MWNLSPLQVHPILTWCTEKHIIHTMNMHIDIDTNTIKYVYVYTNDSHIYIYTVYTFLYIYIYTYIFRHRGREGERERESHQIPLKNGKRTKLMDGGNHHFHAYLEGLGTYIYTYIHTGYDYNHVFLRGHIQAILVHSQMSFTWLRLIVIGKFAVMCFMCGCFLHLQT